jgi:hypothetical protein
MKGILAIENNLGRKIISKLDFESCPKMIIEKLARK